MVTADHELDVLAQKISTNVKKGEIIKISMTIFDGEGETIGTITFHHIQLFKPFGNRLYLDSEGISATIAHL